MFKIFGHQKVLILNGGYLNWKKNLKLKNILKVILKLLTKFLKKIKLFFLKKKLKIS